MLQFRRTSFNYKADHACDRPNSAATTCQDPSRMVNWDGIHLSQAANRVIATKILSRNYSSKPSWYQAEGSLRPMIMGELRYAWEEQMAP